MSRVSVFMKLKTDAFPLTVPLLFTVLAFIGQFLPVFPSFLTLWSSVFNCIGIINKKKEKSHKLHKHFRNVFGEISHSATLTSDHIMHFLLPAHWCQQSFCKTWWGFFFSLFIFNLVKVSIYIEKSKFHKCISSGSDISVESITSVRHYASYINLASPLFKK